MVVIFGLAFPARLATVGGFPALFRGDHLGARIHPVPGSLGQRGTASKFFGYAHGFSPHG